MFRFFRKSRLGGDEEANRRSDNNNEKETNGSFKELIELLYDEGIKFGLRFQDMYDLDFYELQNTIEYTKKGMAYKIWRMASLTRSPFIKNFPETPEEACPELYPPKPSIKMPDFLKEKYYRQKGVKINERR